MTRRRSWLLLPAVAAIGSGCSGPSLVAEVDVPATLKSTCVRVVALADGAEITSSLVELPAASNPLRVAIFEPQGQARQVSVVARGYVGSNGCDEPLLLNDESAPATAEFKAGSGGTAPLSLLAPPPALDADRDGYRQASSGGPDCDDRRGSVHPGAAESCGDVVDNDCDGQTDCEQSSCLAQACGGGRSCTPQGMCEGRESACTNGSDDDMDGLTDCLDLDCENASCNDGDLCTSGDKCQGGQCTGAAVTCGPPPSNPCLDPAGTCNPADGGCTYPALAGQACGGSNVCDLNGGCGPLYSYTTSNFTLPAATPFVPLKFDCVGTVTLDTTPSASPAFTGQTCGVTQFPTLIDETQSGAGPAAIVPVKQLSIAAGVDLVVIGPRPVIFAVLGDAQIDGRLWFAPGTGPSGSGAGVNGQCGGGVGQAGASNANGGGGGGGGTYGTVGFQGGQGANGGNGGNVGTPYGNTNLMPLLGGCQGGFGGNSGGPVGGGGGGAVQISATESVIVRGAVAAPGGGGQGGQMHQTGGGGGGAGGAVLVEGKSVRVSPAGKLIAAGGGGGEGDACCTNGTLDGAAGGMGPVDNTGRAGGGNAGGTWSMGGNGGVGAGGNQPATVGAPGTQLVLPTVTYNSGGGGGGGGLGRIRINASVSCQLDGGQLSGVVSGNTAPGCQ